jgi:tetratricopeptide (TPR) repeat protein
MLAAAMAIPAPAQAAGDSLAQANAALQAGEADKAMTLLRADVQSGKDPAEAHNLECRVLFTLEQWNNAVKECEQAVNLDRQNSTYHLWLGRALGEKASRASFLNAYSLAKRTRAEFELAVLLNPRNAEALTSLGEYYEQAPGIVGGGLGKAENVAAQLEKVDAARAHELRARIAEQRKDYGSAEREFKQAIATSAHPALQWMILASFYERRQRWTEMEWAVRSGASAAEHDRHAGVALYNGASVLIRTHRNPVLAAKMLEDYLALSYKSEEAPAFIAHLWLAQLKQQLGDAEAAKQETATAQSMARDYRPAPDSRQ